MVDIGELSPFATSTPEEAAENIKHSDVFSMTPTEYKDNKTSLAPEIESMLKPKITTETVGNWMKQSTEHAALAMPDVPHLSLMEETVKYAGDILFDRPTPDQEIVDLSNKKMDDPNEMTAAEHERLWQLNYERQDKLKKGYFEPPSIGGQVGHALLETGRDIRHNAELIATMTAGGFGTGLITPVPGGALGGAAIGLGLGLESTFAITGYDKMRGSLYNELSSARKVDGTPINMDEDSKRRISTGAGVVAGVANAILGRALVRTTPFLQKFMDPSILRDVIGNETGAAIKETLSNIGKTVGIGYTAAGLTEASAVIAEEMGKNYNGTEASFIGALKSAGTKLETLKRVNDAAAVGGLTAGTIATVTGATGFNTTKSRIEAKTDAFETARRDFAQKTSSAPVEPDVPVTPKALPAPGGSAETGPTLPGSPITPKTSPRMQLAMRQSVKALELQDALNAIGTISKRTNMSKVAPDQLTELKGDMAVKNGITEVFISKESLQKFTDSEQKAIDVRNAIDPTGITVAAMNGPVRFTPHQFFALQEKYPEITEIVQRDPNEPSPERAKEFAKKHQEAQAQRVELSKKLGATPTTPEDLAVLAKATEHTEADWNVTNEESFLDRAKFPEGLREKLPKGFVDNFEAAIQRSRENVVGKISAQAEYERQSIVDQQFEISREAQQEVELQRLESDPHVKLVEKFTVPAEHETGKKIPRERTFLFELMEPHAKPGFSPFAIDPRSLPYNLEHFAKDPQLKKNKVFVKGGISADEAARLLNVKDATTLLSILKYTKSKEEILQLHLKAAEQELRDKADETTEPNHPVLAKIYSDERGMNRKMMDSMLDHEWVDTRGALKKLARKPPRSDLEDAMAYKAVSKLKVEELNHKVYTAAADKSLKLAMDNMVTGDFETAWTHFENRGTALAIAEQVVKAKAQTARAMKFFRRMEKPEQRQILKDAGPVFTKALDELADVYNFNPNKKGQSERGSFQKFVIQAAESGMGVYEIPERLSDVRASINEMTVEEMKLAYSRAKTVFHQAKLKNKLMDEYEKETLIQSLDAIAQHLESVPRPLGYNKDRVVNKQTGMNPIEKSVDWLYGLRLDTSNVLDRLLKAQNDNYVGPFVDIFYNRVIGLGRYAGTAQDAVNQEFKGIDDQFEKLSEQFGTRTVGIKKGGKLTSIKLHNFMDLYKEKVFVPEFAKSIALGGGHVTKMDLFVMMLNRGTESNHQALNNFDGDITSEVIERVLDRELDTKFAVMAQGMLDMSKSYAGKVQAHEKEFSGDDVEMLPAKPFVHKGIEYPGGYYRLWYDKHISINREAGHNLDQLDLSIDSYQENAGQLMTRQWHLKERVGSKAPLNLDIDNFKRAMTEIVYDIHMRKVLRDVNKLMDHGPIRAELVARIGYDGTQIVQDFITAARVPERFTYDQTTNQSRSKFQKLSKMLGNNFAINVLAYNLPSIFVQGTTAPRAIARLDVNSAMTMKHVLRVAKAWAVNGKNIPEFFKLAGEIHPEIRRSIDGYEDHAIELMRTLIPKKGYIPVLTDLKNLNNTSNAFGMSGMAFVDNVQKAFFANVAYSMYMAGDSSEITDRRAFLELPEAERRARAMQFSSAFMLSVFTTGKKEAKSRFENSPRLEGWSRFFNDARSLVNSNFAVVRQSAGDVVGIKRALFPSNEGGGGKPPPLDPPPDGEKEEPLGENGNKKHDRREAFGHAKNLSMRLVNTWVSMIIIQMMLDTILGNPLPFSEEEREGKTPLELGENFLNYITHPRLALQWGKDAAIARDLIFAASKESKFTDKKTVFTPETRGASDIATAVSGITRCLLMTDGMCELSDNEVKAMFYTTSYTAVPMPMNAIYKAKTAIDEMEKSPLDILHGITDWFIEKWEGKLPDEYIDQVKKIRDDTAVQTEQAVIIPSDANEAIKQAESGGNWWVKDPKSTAAGFYGWTESAWKQMMIDAPELGLTEDGRTQKDGKQQERAMNYSQEQNGNALVVSGLEATKENLYAAHLLGPMDAIKVLTATGGTKLKTLVPPEFLETKELSKNTKVSDFKSWLSSKLKPTLTNATLH